jgi:hypothetical protein
MWTHSVTAKEVRRGPAPPQAMDWLVAPEYWLARIVFYRLLGLIYLVAFASAFNQFPALCGERGLLPAGPYLRAAGARRAPSLFHLHYSDRFARAVAAAGMVIAGAAVLGIVERLPLAAATAAWLALWLVYLSFVNAGGMFFGFVWETLLLEAGFLAVFLGSGEVAPLWPAVLALRWLLVRLEVGAGLIKLRADEAWRNLTALDYHHQTQPIPNRFSWWFHHLPKPVHRLEVIGNHVAQLVVPFGLLLPQPIAAWAGAFVVVTQLWLMASGNFAWLNLLTITLAVGAFHADALRLVLPVEPPALAAPPGWFTAAVVAMAAAMVVLSWRPLRNMASRHQVMNASYNPLHLGNTYGLFGHMTRERLEIVLEGTDDPDPGPHTVWKAYEFKAKPGGPGRRPRQVAPYHLRLDWLMWFAALSPAYAEGWFLALAAKLLSGDPATLKLLAVNPFPQSPPRYLRALLYRYRFTTPAERRATGDWWHRELVGLYLPPIALRVPDTAGQPAGEPVAA